MQKPKYIYPEWNVPPQVKALITTRLGGCSSGKYTSFNIATHVGDDYVTVLKNRQLLRSSLPNEPTWLKQTHSSNILDLRYQNQDLSLHNEYDAIIINNKNTIGCVMTADCVPILIVDKNVNIIAAIHAGWRGAVDNIVAKTIKQMNIAPKDLIAYIGPSICKEHFEVGNDCYLQFINLDKNYASFFTSQKDKFLCNLALIIQEQLLQSGVELNQIFKSTQCTFCEEDTFFSYRRDGVTGRIASLIWLEDTTHL